MTRRPIRPAGAVGALALAATTAALAACGSGGTHSSAGGSTPAGAAGSAAASQPSGASVGPATSRPDPMSTTPPAPGSSTGAPITGSESPNVAPINRVVPARHMSTAVPVPLSKPAAFSNTVALRLSRIVPITVQAHRPGEFSGPALALHFTMINNSAAAINVGNVVVNVLDSRSDPAAAVSSSPTAPFHGTVAPKHRASATYVFTVATSHRAPITVSASYTNAAPVVVFTGAVR